MVQVARHGERLADVAGRRAVHKDLGMGVIHLPGANLELCYSHDTHLRA